MHFIVCCCFEFIIKSIVHWFPFTWTLGIFCNLQKRKKFHHFHLFFVSWEFEWSEESKQEERETTEDVLHWTFFILSHWSMCALTKCDLVNDDCFLTRTPPDVGLQTHACVHVWTCFFVFKCEVMSRPTGTSAVSDPLNLWSRYGRRRCVSPSGNNFMAVSACLV